MRRVEIIPIPLYLQVTSFYHHQQNSVRPSMNIILKEIEEMVFIQIECIRMPIFFRFSVQPRMKIIMVKRRSPNPRLDDDIDRFVFTSDYFTSAPTRARPASTAGGNGTYDLSVNPLQNNPTASFHPYSSNQTAAISSLNTAHYPGQTSSNPHFLAVPNGPVILVSNLNEEVGE